MTRDPKLQAAELARTIIKEAIRHHATEVYVTPDPKESRIECCIDGSRLPVADFPRSLHEALVRELQKMASVNPISVCERRHGKLTVGLDEEPDYEVMVQIVEGGRHGETVVIVPRPTIHRFARAIAGVVGASRTPGERKRRQG